MKSSTILIDRRTELSNLNFVKTILMLIVVLYHCILFWNGNWFVGEPAYASQVLSIVAQWMNTFHIYAFTLVSGYLFYYLKCENGKYDRFFPFLINKVKRLLVPYVFVSLVWVIPFTVYFFQHSISDIIINFGLGVSPNQLWFLLMLFGVFIFFYPLSGFFQKHKIGGIVLVIAFYGIGLIGQAVLPNVFQIFHACTYIPLFWLGFKIRQYGSGFLRRIPTIVWIILDISLFILFRVVSGLNGFMVALLKQGIHFLLCIVGSLMAFVILQKLASRVSWKDSKIFSFLSKNSMTVYLLHQQVIYIFIFLLNGVINPYIHSVVNFLGAMLISLSLASLLTIFKWTKFLIGEK